MMAPMLYYIWTANVVCTGGLMLGLACPGPGISKFLKLNGWMEMRGLLFKALDSFSYRLMRLAW